MLNAISAEFMKMQKNKILFISVLFVISVPIFFILHGLFFEPEMADAMPSLEWLQVGILYCGAMVLPVMSGFVMGFSIHQEYQNQTVVNMLTAPVNRINFIMAKVVAWFLWYVMASVIAILFYTLGYFLIYTATFNFRDTGTFIFNFSRMATLSFIAHLPLLWVAIKQRKIFYPVLLAVLVITAIQVSAVQISEEMLFLASIVPWSAVTLVGVTGINFNSIYQMIGLISILSSGILGIVLTCLSFSRQDQ